MYDMFDIMRSHTSCHVEILAASLRTLEHIQGSIALGADIVTAPLLALQAWVDAGSNRSPSESPRPANLQPIEYQELQYEEDFSRYSIDKSESGLLYQGLTKFVKDWQSVVE